jgi:Co/Zn/Cd efflux system component
VSHLRSADGTVLCEHAEPHEPWPPAPGLAEPEHDQGRNGEEHEHSHGLPDRSVLRSRAGIRAVSLSLAILIATALAQVFIYSRTLSVALLADLIHNFGDALTAIPLGLAFFLRSLRGERLAGLAVVAAIFISALVALDQTVDRFIHPRSLSHLWLLAAAGVIGFIGNEIAAQVRLRAGHRLQSPALIADGKHARVDGFVSLGVLAQTRRPDHRPRDHARHHITWESWRTISSTDPGELLDDPEH